MLQISIAFLHLILSIFICCYFLWRRPSYDKYYILYFILLNLSWLVFSDECLVSFIFKIIKDPSYILGDTHDIDDVIVLIVKPITDILVLFLIPIAYIINILVIVQDGKFDSTMNTLLIAGIISYCVYTYTLKMHIKSTAAKVSQGVIYTALLFESFRLFSRSSSSLGLY